MWTGSTLSERFAHICPQKQHLWTFEKRTPKPLFFATFWPGCAWWVQIRFGARFCVEPVKMRVLSGKFTTFVWNTSSLIFMTSWKWAPQAKLVEKCPKLPKFRLFQNLLKNKLNVIWYQNLLKNVIWDLKQLCKLKVVTPQYMHPSGTTLEKSVARIFEKTTKIAFFKSVPGGCTYPAPLQNIFLRTKTIIKQIQWAIHV